MTRSRRVLSLVVASFLLAAAVFLYLSRPTAAAGPVISMTTSPVSLDLPIQPGATATRTLQLKNNGTQPLQITMELELFGPHGNGGEAAITKPSPNDPSPSWVHFSPSTFTAQPGVWVSVQMTIQLPKSASLGYYYAVIFKPTIPGQPTPGTNTIKGSNAILILVDTGSANENRQIQIADFSVSKRVYEYLPAKFTVTIRNSGNIYLAPTGNIFISRRSDVTHSVATININASSANVLPNSNRVFQANWSDGFPAFQPKLLDGQPVLNAKGQPVEQLVWNFSSSLSKFRIGKYYAQLALVFSNNGKVIPLTGLVSFWVIPWKLILLILLALVMCILLWVLLKKLIKLLWRKVHSS